MAYDDALFGGFTDEQGDAFDRVILAARAMSLTLDAADVAQRTYCTLLASDLAADVRAEMGGAGVLSPGSSRPWTGPCRPPSGSPRR